jgi:hypothetical protein
MTNRFYVVTFDVRFTELGVITWQQEGQRAIRANDEHGAMVDVARGWPEGWAGEITAREITDLLELVRFGIHCGAVDSSLLAIRERAEHAVSLTGTQAWITEAEAITAEAERRFQKCVITPSPSRLPGLTDSA